MRPTAIGAYLVIFPSAVGQWWLISANKRGDWQAASHHATRACIEAIAPASAEEKKA